MSLEFSGMEENSQIYKIDEVRTVLDAQPTIVIGQDQCVLIIARKIYQSYWKASFVSKTLLRWVVYGRYLQREDPKTHEEIDEGIDTLVKESFRIENFGINYIEGNGRSK